MDVLVLLVARVDHSCFAHKADAAFPRISPDRLQFYEYESVTVSCEEFSSLTEWRVMTKVNKTISPNCDSSPSCTIEPTFERHSGEYWCEDAEGQTSGVLNISVTAGSVILDFPARPVIEGSDVILYCRKEESQSKHIADFYKDDFHLMTSYENNMIIQNVSKSDEGLYKCRISGAGESPESRLTVLTQSKSAYEEPPSHSVSSDPLSLLWIVLGVVLVALVLSVMGLILCSKRKVSAEDSLVDPHHATYAVVKKQRKEKVSAGDVAVESDVTYAVVENHWKKKVTSCSVLLDSQSATEHFEAQCTFTEILSNQNSKMHSLLSGSRCPDPLIVFIIFVLIQMCAAQLSSSSDPTVYYIIIVVVLGVPLTISIGFNIYFWRKELQQTESKTGPKLDAIEAQLKKVEEERDEALKSKEELEKKISDLAAQKTETAKFREELLSRLRETEREKSENNEKLQSVERRLENGAGSRNMELIEEKGKLSEIKWRLDKKKKDTETLLLYTDKLLQNM
ncbi:Fc region receptor II [Collichthys lucidus]|uniref:Fc region receptor II n=1 Tax=Collichthys lucidus TaxID=240159 RepID=A0A4U5VWS1_COLLU|nr:Fc region receptor II [Collichthys lucidus]